MPSFIAQLVKNPHAMQETPVRFLGREDPWVGKIPWRMERLPTPVFWPGDFHGLYSPGGHKKSDMTEIKDRTGFKIARRNINNLRYTNDTILTAESDEELQSLLMKVKEESEKVGLKLSIQKTKTMASGPITSWQIAGETMETVTDFNWRGSKIKADGDCSHEIKRHFLLGRKAINNIDRILKSREIMSPTKVRLVKATVFQ